MTLREELLEIDRRSLAMMKHIVSVWGQI